PRRRSAQRVRRYPARGPLGGDVGLRDRAAAAGARRVPRVVRARERSGQRPARRYRGAPRRRDDRPGARRRRDARGVPRGTAETRPTAAPGRARPAASPSGDGPPATPWPAGPGRAAATAEDRLAQPSRERGGRRATVAGAPARWTRTTGVS